jgi:serine/threonine protein kinase
MSRYQNVPALPDLLQPLVDHPMFEMSRYLREFSEIGMIGKGGYGKVYHVKHRLDGSDYAVKKIILSKW